jgi:DNA-binding PadR family transcriptional regulator
MENVILGLLVIQSLTLYEINQMFKQGISMFYSASYGSLQTGLKNLLSRGLIVFEERVEGGRNKKVYSITPAGKETFFNWMIAETPLSKLEVTGLSKVYFLGLIPDVETRKAIVSEILQKIQMMECALADLDEEIKAYPIPTEWEDVVHYSRKTLGYGRGAHAFAHTWFEELLEELKGLE